VSGHGLSDKDDLPVPVVRPRVARRLPAKCYQTKHPRMGLLTRPSGLCPPPAQTLVRRKYDEPDRDLRQDVSTANAQ